MKLLLKIWLLAFVPLLCQAQDIKDLVFKRDLEQINARLEFLEKEIKKGGTGGTRVVLDSCKKGPTIEGISKITSTGATLLFDADGVPAINYDILSGDGNTWLYSDSLVNLQSNSPTFKYGKDSKVFPDGSYYLRIQGRSCVSKPSQRKFTIKSNAGEVTVPVEGGGGNPPPSTVGKLTLKTLAQGMDEHLQLVVRDSADYHIFSDVAPDLISPIHNYRYLVNGEILTQKKRLTNYRIAKNNQIRIVKFKLRQDLSTINHWGTQPSDYAPANLSEEEKRAWYYQPNAGELFSYNTSFAFNTFVGTGPQAESGFLNHIPQSYNPSNQMVSWPDLAPDMQLPKGHMWVADWTGWTTDLIYRKGVTHLTNHSLPWGTSPNERVVYDLKDAGKTYNNVPRNEVIYGLVKRPPVIIDGKVQPDDYSNGYNKSWWPNGPFDPETAIQKAEQADISDALWIGETMENESWMFDNVEMHRHFYKRLRERYEDRFGKRGIPYEIVHNYYYLWPEPISLSRNRPADYFRKLLVTKPEDLPKTPYSPGGVLSSTTMITEGIYLGAPDVQIGLIYETIFRFHINAILGYKSGVFLAAQHEYRPNNRYKFIYPEGKFYPEKKIPIDPNVHIAAGFIGQVYGNLFVEWGAPGKKDHKRFSYEWAKGLWFPNGATQPQDGFPYYSFTNDYYAGFDGGADLSYFSQALYNKTFGQTNGGQRQYLTHRIDGGQWVRPDQANAQEIVNAYDAKRGFVYSQRKDGKIAWFYLNSFADNNWHTLEVELPNGQVKAFRVAGNGIHARID